ncbi:MAG: phytanoyl-CoA dioxygenase family protein, partial [Planctomycetota bacterium]
VALHQDLSLPVRERRDAAGWSGWSEKDGVMFAQPPVTVLERVLGVRLHLDPCDADDGALCVVPGSHRHGRLDPAAAAALRERSGEEPCVAAAGDVLLLRPLLLHRSPKSTSARPRRVLHFVFGPGTLPDGMAWPEPATVNDR